MGDKPLGRKAYGSIGHLPGSRRGPGDHGVNEGQARICTERTKHPEQRVIVQEKVDGSCVAVAKVSGEIVALNRAGYRADSAPREQHRMFARWVAMNRERFEWLAEGERVVGEWLALAHGTRYDLSGREPFVAFDIMREDQRKPWKRAVAVLDTHGVPMAPTLHIGGPCPLDEAERDLGRHGRYGAIDPAEGLVYRVERAGRVDFLAKYVRPDKVDGCYLPDISGAESVWNWHPNHAIARD